MNSTLSKWWLKLLQALITYHLSLITSFLASCSTPADETAAVLIPEEATVVACFNPATLMERDAATLKEAVSSRIVDDNASRPLRRLIDKLLDDPLKVGISTDMPIYYYSTLSGEWAVVGAVDSRRKLTNAFSRLAADEHLPEMEQNGDYSIFLRDSTQIIFNDSYFYFGRPASEPATTVATLSHRADCGEAWGGNSLFSTINDSEGDVRLIVTGAALAASCQMGTIGRALPDDTALADLDLQACASMVNGNTTVTIDMLPRSDGWREFIDKADQAAQPLRGSQVRYMPSDGLTILVNTTGSSLYDALESIARAANAANEGTLSQLRSVCGEVSGTMEANIGSDGSLCVYMATTDTCLTHLVRELVLSDDSTLTLAPAQYAFCLDTLSRPSSFFGRDRGQTYLTTGGRQPFATATHALPDSLVRGRGFCLNAAGSYFSDSCLFRQFTHSQAYYSGQGRVVIVLFR